MYIMNNIIKYLIFYSWTLAVIQVLAFPIPSEVIEPEINYGPISEENIHTETNEGFNNDEAEVNRSKKSATTFCVEIKSGTPECVPCQPVMMGAQPQVVYVSENNTSSDSNMMNNTITLRQNEVVLPPELPCPKDEIFLILPPQQVQPTVSLVQVPVVHQVPQSPQILVATKPFLQAHFPELLNDSNVQIQPLMSVDESLPIINPQFPQLFPHSANTFAMNKNDNWNVNLNLKENTFPQAVIPPGFKLPEPSEDQGIGANFEFGAEVRNQSPFLQPPEHQNIGQNFEYEAEPGHPPSIGSLENHGMGQNFGFGVEVQHQQSPFMINQQGSAFNTRVPPQQYSSSFMNNHASGQVFINGGVGQLPIQEPVKSQRPVNANDFQTQQSYFSNMNVVMGHDGRGYYLIPAMMNGSPQLCLQPEPMTSPALNNINQQSLIQQQNLSASDSQQSSSINKQWSSREIKDPKGTLQVPEVQTTVAPIKSGLKSQDAKGKGGSLSQLNHLKGPSLTKGKTFGKRQNKESKSDEKPELKRGNKRETEISVDK